MEARLVDAASQGDLNSVRAILTSTDANVDGLDVSRHVGFFSVNVRVLALLVL